MRVAPRCQTSRINHPSSIPQQAPLPSWLKQAQYVSKADLNFLYQECHSQRVYEQKGVRIRPNDIVIDVGANIGMFSTRAAQVAAKVYALEPLPRTYQALVHNIHVHKEWCQSHGLPCADVVAVQSGVGNGSLPTMSFTFYPRAAGWGTMVQGQEAQVYADMEIFINNVLDDGASAEMLLSLPVALFGRTLQRRFPKLYKLVIRIAVSRMMANKQVIDNIDMTTVSQIIKEHGIEKVGLLKVDVERAELQVLQGVQDHDWEVIQQAALEVHDEKLEKVLGILTGKEGFTSIEVNKTPDLQGTSISMVYCTKRRNEL